MPQRVGLLLLLVLVLGACRRGDQVPIRGAAADTIGHARLDPSRSPPIVREPSVVAFWLPASDTLDHAGAADLLDDFRFTTREVSRYLESNDIQLYATNSDSVIVELDGGPRRVITLSGLDYPFGYVLVQPGFAESILTGVSTDEELLDEVDWYFGLGESEPESGQVVRAGRPVSTGRHAPSGIGLLAPAPVP